MICLDSLYIPCMGLPTGVARMSRHMEPKILSSLNNFGIGVKLDMHNSASKCLIHRLAKEDIFVSMCSFMS